MKKHLFKSRLLSSIIFFVLVMTFASCGNEDVVQNSTKIEDDKDTKLTSFVAVSEVKSNTSLDYNTGNSYWNPSDYIYVKDDDGILQKSSNAPTSKVASFEYKVPGKFTRGTSYTIYYLGKISNGSQVTIPSVQTQIVPNNSDHFGVSGNYGLAIATKVKDKRKFTFSIEYQVSYLVFQPYTSDKILQNCYLTKVEVSSDNNIAETYTFNPSTRKLTGSLGSKQIVLETGGSSSNPNGFPLNNSAASVKSNGAYMIIKSGAHCLRVRYWIKEVATNVEGTITKLYPSTLYASNTYYNMTDNLNERNYDGDNYYMWDAQQQYWYGYEWSKKVLNGQPTLNSNLPGSTISNAYAQNNRDPRYYNEGNALGGLTATHSCTILPNANEMSWYCMYGNPYWDAEELWTTMGHLYKGGIWLKKKSVLTAEGHYSTENSADGSTDLRITYKYYKNNTINYGTPSVADANNYFYLPALGYYQSGQLYNVGIYGVYWTSSAYPWYRTHAYRLHFGSGYADVGNNFRYLGFKLEIFK